MSGQPESCEKGETALRGSGGWICTGQFIRQNYGARMDNRIILKPFSDASVNGAPKYIACADCPARRPLPAEEVPASAE